MPSVVACWTGSCPTPPVAAGLLRRVRRLGDVACRHGGGVTPEVFDNVVLAGRTAVRVPRRAAEAAETVWVDRVVLNGVRIWLADPRELYATDLSFVFATLQGHSELSGLGRQARLVEVVPAERLAWSARHGELRGADHVLAQPTLHLRYLYEGWFDKLMAWVRLFYVGDLSYWRYSELPGFDRYAPAQFRGNYVATHDRLYEELVAELVEVGSMAARW